MTYLRLNLNNGYVELQADDKNVWITASEADSPPQLIGLYKEIKKLLNEEYPEHAVQFFIDATNDKLLEAFINHSEFRIEYVSFSWIRAGSISSNDMNKSKEFIKDGN
jgi:hypothetical protein